MGKKTIPIGIADLHSIRALDCYYVDKTPYIEKLFDQGKYYFLSRPRRFGKSLLLDTMMQLFEGNETLFQGLPIHGRWDWSKPYPAVRLSFGGNRYSEPGVLKKNVKSQLEWYESKHGVNIDAASDPTEPDRFGMLLRRIHANTGRPVVVLVDEYDKPILDAIDTPELAKDNRDYLQGLYAVIKDFGNEIRFAFLTGITMFSKMSLFSTLNNLTDISLNPRYSSICGYTETDLYEVFTPEMGGLCIDEIRKWYNGYGWRGEEKVYNPWAILNLLSLREFKPYWSVTGMPSYLYKVMMERNLTPLDANALKVDESFISTIDIDNIGAPALLFQSGYLTITGEHREVYETVYELDYPNLEVCASLNSGYLKYLFGQGETLPSETKLLAVRLQQQDFEGFATAVRALFSGIPHQWHKSNNKMAHYEGWYCSVLYSCLWDVAHTARICGEVSSSGGRSDLVVIIGTQVFVFECKMLMGGADADQKAFEAIARIRDRGYADQYRDVTNAVFFHRGGV